MNEKSPDRRRVIVGLGNPGSKYAGTRHNVGWRVIDLLKKRWSLMDESSNFDSIVTNGFVNRSGELPARVMLLKPMTFMNLSGKAVQAAADFYKVAREDVIVVLDDMNLPLGRVRIRKEGSAGGHNGLSDVMRAMGGQDVPRLRIGIGQPPARWNAVDFVTAAFDDSEKEEVNLAVVLAADAVEDWLFRDMAYIMGYFNGL